MANDVSLHIGTGSFAGTENRAARGGIIQRFVKALRDSRRRAVEREVERFIQCHGGRLTDELEREISRRFGGIVGS
jgi:hypothetical protein